MERKRINYQLIADLLYKKLISYLQFATPEEIVRHGHKIQAVANAIKSLVEATNIQHEHDYDQLKELILAEFLDRLEEINPPEDVKEIISDLLKSALNE